MQHLIEAVGTLNHSYAYSCMKELVAVSKLTADVYPYLDNFADMLSSDNSYVRTRGMLLMIANAKWDSNEKINAVLDSILALLCDPSALSVRKTIQMLPTLALYKPILKADIVLALQKLELAKYSENMRVLLERDREKALEELDAD